MKANRMFSILNLLINNQKMTAKELAEKLEVSKRTIYRDIEDLNMAGVPVVSFPGQGGGLGVLDNYKLDKKFLTIDELENILVGLQALKSIGTETNVSTLMNKLDMDDSEIMENANTIIDLSSWIKDTDLKEYLSAFKKAIRNKNIVVIEYQAKKGFSKRQIEPYKLVFKQASWYLFAFCLEKEEYRLFKIDRIISFKVVDISFAIRDTYAKELASLFKREPFLNQENRNKFQVILQYQQENEELLRNTMDIRVFSFDTDKKIITFTSSNYEWVVDFVLGLKDKVKIIEPEYLVKDIKNIIKKINTIYQES